MTRDSVAITVGPDCDRPERARACLLAGEAAADHAQDRPRLGETSRRAIDRADRTHVPWADSGPAGPPGPADAPDTAGPARWPALCQAPEGGADVTGPARITGWPRTRRDRRRQFAGTGRGPGASGGRCRARRPGGGPCE